MRFGSGPTGAGGGQAGSWPVSSSICLLKAVCCSGEKPAPQVETLSAPFLPHIIIIIITSAEGVMKTLSRRSHLPFPVGSVIIYQTLDFI